MFPRRVRMGFLAVIGAFLLLGCGNLLRFVQQAQEVKSTVEAAATQIPATVAAAASQIPTAAGAEAEEGGAMQAPAAGDDTLHPEDLILEPEAADEVHTIRLFWEYSLNFDDTGESITISRVEATIDKDRPAEHVRITGVGGSIMEWIRVGDQIWMQSGGVWVASSGGPETTLDMWLSGIWDPIGEGSAWQRVGEETVAGLPARHYHQELPPGVWAQGAVEALQGTELAAQYTLQVNGPATIDLWVAEHLPLRYEFRAPVLITDNAGTQHPGVIGWRYEVEALNAPVDIQPPAEAAALNRPPIPVPEGAELLVAEARTGSWTYRVPNTDLGTVIAFYQQQADSGALQLTPGMGGANQGFWQATITDAQGQTWQLMLSGGAGEVNLLIQRKP